MVAAKHHLIFLGKVHPCRDHLDVCRDVKAASCFASDRDDVVDVPFESSRNASAPGKITRLCKNERIQFIRSHACTAHAGPSSFFMKCVDLRIILCVAARILSLPVLVVLPPLFGLDRSISRVSKSKILSSFSLFTWVGTVRLAGHQVSALNAKSLVRASLCNMPTQAWLSGKIERTAILDGILSLLSFQSMLRLISSGRLYRG